jgi:hypothetical protein
MNVSLLSSGLLYSGSEGEEDGEAGEYEESSLQSCRGEEINAESFGKEKNSNEKSEGMFDDGKKSIRY